MKGLHKKYFLMILSAIAVAGFAGLFAATAQGATKAAFLYNLSTFTGPVPYSAPRMFVDKERNEVSVLFQNGVSIFNENGMEIYRFGDDLDLGYITDLTVNSAGDILMLAYSSPPESAYRIVRCNFRGEPTGKIEIGKLPAAFSGFSPGRLAYRNGSLYLADPAGLKIVVTDEEGKFMKGYDLFALLKLKQKDKGNVEISGFSVADDGSVLFTIPVLFAAFRLYPDGKIASFGRPGSAPGRFNIVSGIALDSKGDYLVVDKLKCTVMVFDKDYNYLTQFGFRGYRGGNLIAPDDVVVDKNDRVYVTQNAKRGVSVYEISSK